MGAGHPTDPWAIRGVHGGTGHVAATATTCKCGASGG